MKKLKKMGFRHLGGKKRGFTLIELLIVMVILAILAGIVIISIGGVIGRGQQTAYNAERESLQTAVLSYFATGNSTWPWPTTNGTAPGIIKMSLLTVATAPALPYLDETPKSAHVDNSCTDTCTGHYLWKVDAAGHVFSECKDLAGSLCACDTAAVPTKSGWCNVYP